MAELLLFWRPRRESFLWLLQLLKDACALLLRSLPSSLKQVVWHYQISPAFPLLLFCHRTFLLILTFLPSSYKDPVITLAPPDNPGQSIHLKILNPFFCHKIFTPLSCKIIFTDSEDQNVNNIFRCIIQLTTLCGLGTYIALYYLYIHISLYSFQLASYYLAIIYHKIVSHSQ